MVLTGVQFVSAGAPTGYGLAAIAYVRGLVNAGVPVHWVTTQWNRPTLGFEPRMGQATAGDESLRDLAALVEATRRPVRAVACIVQMPPEEWQRWHRPGQRNIGYTTWETDRPPAHWVPLLNNADKVLVPCRFNQVSFSNHGVWQPIDVVPHIRRHRWNTFGSADRDAYRLALGIKPGNKVFYCINNWDVRKNLGGLVRAFASAFNGADSVTLVIKTSVLGNDAGPLHGLVPTTTLLRNELQAAQNRSGRASPQVVLIARDTVSGRDIDMLHEIGDCYVSLSFGEGWGLAAFDAASRGTPVIATPWSATSDFLGQHWPGALPFTLRGACLWPVTRPSYFPTMRWAVPDEMAAAQRMRDFIDDPAPFNQAARSIERDILNRFSEPVVTQQMLAAIAAPVEGG
jgi:glycosyltransferase involved in cell wall biosynthesis